MSDINFDEIEEEETPSRRVELFALLLALLALGFVAYQLWHKDSVAPACPEAPVLEEPLLSMQAMREHMEEKEAELHMVAEAKTQVETELEQQIQRADILETQLDSTRAELEDWRDKATALQTAPAPPDDSRACSGLEQKYVQLQQTHSELQQTYSELQQTHASTLARLSGDQKSAQQAGEIAQQQTARALADLQSEHETTLTRLKTEQEATLSRVQSEHDTTLTQLKSEHENALSQLRSEQENTVTQLAAATSRIESLNQELTGLQDDLKTARRDLETTTAAKQEIDAELSRLKRRQPAGDSENVRELKTQLKQVNKQNATFERTFRKLCSCRDIITKKCTLKARLNEQEQVCAAVCIPKCP